MADRDTAARVIRHARREALIVLTVWALALAWTVGYCYLRGYEHAADSAAVRLGLASERPADTVAVLGLPGWVLVGIVLPWLACTAFTVFFGLFVMKDDDLGAEAGEDGHGH